MSPRLLLCVFFASAGAFVQAQPARRPVQASSSFDAIARDAEAARAAGGLEEAASLYRKALALRPRWAEGLWAIGAMAYERDRYAECRDAFQRLTEVEPKTASAWALQGLCEFGSGDHTIAREHLARAVALGMPPREDLSRVCLYHYALLLVRETNFDLAIVPLTTILRFQPATPEVEQACGLVLLRRALLPSAISSADRGLVQESGKAYCTLLARHTDEALRLFEALVAKHPRERYLNYGYGLALAQKGSAESLAQYRREIELFPDDVLARLELAFGLLARGREGEALVPAEQAVALAPGLFAAHLVLGRALVAIGKLEPGTRELETAAALAPQIPAIHHALARAYGQAGRGAEAERENGVFQALESARRAPGPDAPGEPVPAAKAP